ncbi:hypothetical protein ABZY16_40275, partial [Streptomyces sp. NPDC006553]
SGRTAPVHCRAAEDPHFADRSGRTTIAEKTDSQAVRLRKGSRDGRPCGFDENRYEKRNTAERAINRLKQSRAVATRYDRRGCLPRHRHRGARCDLAPNMNAYVTQQYTFWPWRRALLTRAAR